MELVSYKDDAKGIIHYHLKIADTDTVKMKLHPFDAALLSECERSDKVSDKILALETITRRIEEANNE